MTRLTVGRVTTASGEEVFTVFLSESELETLAKKYPQCKARSEFELERVDLFKLYQAISRFMHGVSSTQYIEKTYGLDTYRRRS